MEVLTCVVSVRTVVDVISKADVDVPKQSSGGESTNIVLLYYLDNSIVNL